MTTHVRTGFLSTAEAAMEFHVSAATVRRWIAEGKLAGVQIGGPAGAIRIPASELDRLAKGAS